MAMKHDAASEGVAITTIELPFVTKEKTSPSQAGRQVQSVFQHSYPVDGAER
jgi:hypothetical protein